MVFALDKKKPDPAAGTPAARHIFAWSAATGDGGPAASGRIPAGNEAYYSSDPWVGTGVFALDSGFVQVLADLASDRRQLLALRRTDRVEILTYEWIWQPHRARK
ncbi:hypothetical protein [Candidatus Palauibacter sp.]|uniref:hypothetical protein n=1 Tax=Candidatus Palauibacter sp. TaxID=3101350 RepID=UPI003CC51301